MKRQLTLGVQLMLGLGLVMISVSVIIGLVWFMFLSPKAEKMFFQVVSRGAAADVNLVASKHGAEIASLEKNAFKNIINDALAKNPESLAYLLFDSKGKLRLQISRDEKLDFSHIYNEELDLGKKNIAISGDQVAALVPLRLRDGTLGYLVHVESISKYLSTKFIVFSGLALILLIGFVMIYVGAVVIVRSFVKPIELITLSAHHIANGDLQHTSSSIKGVSETNKLSAAVQNMAEALREQVISIKKITTDASLVSGEISVAMTALATSSAEQAAAVAETASTVEELEKAGQNTASNASQIVEAAEKTTEASIRGRRAVDSANDIIFQIKGDSQQISTKSRALLSNVEEIGNIITFVNAIAEQSKILAVNASIEAAKAGEYGSGFAVVALEVKDLAQQSKEATEQITNTLTSVRKSIEGVVDLAGSGELRTERGVIMIANAGAIVNDLSEAIRENSDVANVINASVIQQALGLSQIAKSINLINVSSDENRGASYQMEKTTKDMIISLKELTELVEKWRT